MPFDPTAPIDLGGGQTLPASAVNWSFARASGPGGQNVNKVSTQATLTLELRVLEELLQPAVFARLCTLAARHIHGDERLAITVSASRSQIENRASAVERLQTLIAMARRRPRVRRATRPTAASRQRRLDTKKRRGQIKQSRRGDPPLS